jgi:uncharacterized protein
MSEVKVGKNETLDSALRRFKRTCQKAGVLSEVRKREHYEKPSVKRKKKSKRRVSASSTSFGGLYMSVKDRLTEDMKQAMKAREAGKLRLSVIRMVRASIKNVEIDRRKELSDDEVLDVLAKEVKLRRDAAEEFKKGNRQDLVDTLGQEIAILMQYLPEQMSEAEVRTLVAEAVAATGAADAKEMGKVMAVLMPKVKGRADGKLVNAIVREMLSK